MIDIPGYKIIKELGKGGMAVVYLALQEGLDREVALKVMSPALAADPSFGERFIREARIVAKLSHPQIVTVFDVGQHDNHSYIAMEYHNGGDLKDRIDAGKVTVEQGITVIALIAKALHFAHEQGYIHRDVKPENILFKSNGDPVLSDFGIAKATNSSTQMTQSGSVIGTPRYMSPEQARGKPADGRADIYSLGVIFYELLTGKLPFDGEDSLSIGIKHITDPIPTLPSNLSSYQTILNKFMAKQPNQRYQSGNEAAAALFQLQAPSASTQVFEPVSLESTVVMESIAGTQMNAAIPEQNSKQKLGIGIAVLLVFGLATGGYFQPDFLPESAGEWVKVSLKGEPSKVEREQERLKAEKIAQLTASLEQFIKLTSYELSDIKKAESDWRSLSNIDRTHPVHDNVQPKLQQRYLNFAKRYAILYDFSQAKSLLSDARKFDANSKSYEQASAFISDRERDEMIQKTNGNFKAADYGEFTTDNKQLNELILLIQQAQNTEVNQLFIEPEQDNAAYYYSEILKLEPNALVAKQGLNRIAKHFLHQAKIHIANQRFVEANNAINQAYGVNPSSPDINAVREEFRLAHGEYKQDVEVSEQELEKQNKLNQQLDDLAKQAGEAILSNRLTTPLDKSAYHYYNKMLDIDADNEIAKNGLSDIVSRYLKLADTAINSQSFDNADNYIAQASAVSPTDPRLDAARKKSADANKAFLKEQLQQQAMAAKEKQRQEEALRQAKLKQEAEVQALLEQQQLEQAKLNEQEAAYTESLSTESPASETTEEASIADKGQSNNLSAEVEDTNTAAIANTELAKDEAKSNLTETAQNVAEAKATEIQQDDSELTQGKDSLQDVTASESTSQQLVTETQENIDAETKDLVKAPVEIQAPVEESASDLIAQTTPVEDTTLDAQSQTSSLLTAKQKFRIKILLQSANRLLHNDRLISPKNNSAIYKYINVLRLDNNNPEARAGMQNVVNRLNELADLADSQGRIDDAKILHESALKLSNQFPFLQNDHQHSGE
jgi:serine/threonine-protein kinase PpkA